MKKSIVLFFALVVGINVLHAQQETLFGRANSAGFFVSPIVEFSMLDNEVRSSNGGGLGLIVNNFFIGGYGLAAVDIDAFINDTDEVNVDIAHGGLWLGYVWPSHKLIHFYGSVKGGWGLVNTNFDEFGFDFADRVFVVTPDVGIELNIFRWMRLVGSVGYRSVTGINDSNTVSVNDVNGITGGLTLRIGGFGRHRHHSSKVH